MRKENRMLRMEKEILKKSQCVLREGNEVKYSFIREHAKRWPVVHQSRLLGLQRSACYNYRAQPCKVIPPEELALRHRMKELFKASRDSLGSRTLAENLRKTLRLAVTIRAA